MKLLLFAAMLFAFNPPAMTDLYKDYPVYTGKDLGVHYAAAGTTFKVWAPMASAVVLRLYKDGIGGEAISTHPLASGEQGTWQLTIDKNLKNLYYTFRVQQDGQWLQERPDSYAKAVGVNGLRGMVADMEATNPTGWQTDRRITVQHATDIILYETHVRDISIANNSGIVHKGKFLGFTESGTKNTKGAATGLDHLKELGITHVHLLPAFDFNSVDETKPDLQYNWGYDPLNYNVPEGSFATNPFDGNVRIREFKQMVQALHSNGIGVILDVVYNHTSNLQSNFNQFAPGYYYRQREDGSYADATGCGNETASERPMMRKFIVESVAYWAREYHLDGFRFDLMGVHDITTMNAVSDTLKKIDPSIFVYGEGWTAGASPLDEAERAVKKNTYQLKRIAAFGDEMRDGIKGPFANDKMNGFAGDNSSQTTDKMLVDKESIKFGIVAATQHPQVDYSKVNYSKAAWAAAPTQAISYASCHDDLTLFDRLKQSNPKATEAELIKMDLLANTIVLTSQGVAFLHSGAEMLRTKKGVANSYNAPDSINEINWDRKTKYNNEFNYYKGLVHLRRNHPAFRMPTSELIREHLQFIETNDPQVIAYHLTDHAIGEVWKDIVVIFNGAKESRSVAIPKGKWKVAVDGKTVNEQGIQHDLADKTVYSVSVDGLSSLILYKQ